MVVVPCSRKIPVEVTVEMKRYSSAPCLADGSDDTKKIKSMEEPNAREYLQLALARVLELQREIKEGTYVTDHTSDLGESSSEEDLTKEVLRKVFENLPGTPGAVDSIIDRASGPRNSQLEAIHGKKIQLLGYDTCRRTAVDFMKNAVYETRRSAPSRTPHSNHPGFRLGTYSRNEPRLAHRRTGLLKTSQRKEGGCLYDEEIRDRMLRSLDLHLANKQRDYTAKLMRSGI
ncbi:uncharacterized protein LOC128879011 [Hylaeus volcanicus]|uniref:uncharacterized protein LOC128879011 n=1 Tax=Hylaeus volcanicus TaxID=313075 RepID=UPI0023B7E94A|nr:uncharacterized protein LOC128879011 [Hylaeus volcanicus]